MVKLPDLLMIHALKQGRMQYDSIYPSIFIPFYVFRKIKIHIKVPKGNVMLDVGEAEEGVAAIKQKIQSVL